MLNNPVLRKEFLSIVRMRQMPIATRVGVLIAIVLLLGWIYWQIIVKWLMGDHDPDSGRTAWMFMVSIQFGLICLIAPIITANSITKEKEQQTWESLIFTSLAPGEIIFGKLVARLSIIGGILLLFLPVELFCWMHNIWLVSDATSSSRLTVTQMGLTWLTRIVCTLFFATLGLYLSWLLKRTLYAIMLSYTFVVGILIVATTLLTSMMVSIFTSSDFIYKCPLMWVNPVMLITEAIYPPISPSAVLFLLFGLVVYTVLTLLMLWRMVYGFRRFAFQN